MQILLQTVVILIGVTTIYGCTLCPNGGQYYAVTEKCYWLVKADQGINWNDAHDNCRNDGGDLAVIINRDISYILMELARAAGFIVGTTFDLWFGFFVNGDIEWEWVDGITHTFRWFAGSPAPAAGLCGCISTPEAGLFRDYGYWNKLDCQDLLDGYFCQDDLDPSIRGDCGRNSLFCAETGKCYCYMDDPKPWIEAKECCEDAGGSLAIVKDIKLNTMLRNMVHDFSETDFWAWIGGKGPAYMVSDKWVWCDGTDIVWNNFKDNVLPTGGNGECTQISLIGDIPGRWNDGGCMYPHTFFCCSDRYTSACCDPHFVVTPIGMIQPVCFDYYGDDGDVVQLITSKKYDLAINAEVFSHEHTKKTWFASLSMVFPECEIVADVRGVNVNGKPRHWKDIEDVPCGSSGVTYSIKEDLNRDSTHLIINVMPGAEFIFSKDQKTYKFGTVLYMDFDMTKHYGLDETTDGILGEFMGMRVNLDEDSVRNGTETAILFFPDEPGRGSVTAHRVGRKNLLTNKHFHCWNVEDEGAGLVRGTASDFLVPDLLTGQRAQQFLQKEDEEAADATF